MGVAVQVQAYVTLSRPSYEPERWHAYIIYAFVICFYTLLNVFGVKALHSLNLLGIGTHLGGYLLMIIIMLVYTKDKHIFWTALINAIITLPWLIVLLYCSGNIDDVLSSKIGPISPVTQVRPLPT
ncbi:putative amino acid protein [Neofusicoccum parvum UCRNP2]|uniref:Putative amino acid protein n=1 Tax=Botryosphaeria parva (strain UCR-NP2) TaxID=1287680 RepID=R1EY78_BOTPV|nr:putative amino acid protein [Neofusicoccum parvum UCRNP2]